MPELETEYKAAIKQLSEATDEVKNFAETSKTELKNLGKVTDETKASADKALTALTDISARVTDLEQKASRRGGGNQQPEAKSVGQYVIDSEEVKSILKENGAWTGRARIELKNITSAVAGTSGTGLVVADRVAGIVAPPQRKLVVRDLLMPGNTSSNAIDYVKETGFTNNAAEVAENPSAAKPKSDITFDLENLPVRTIAHFVLASVQVLADAPMLASYINGRLIYGLKLREDNQLLNGDGTGVNLKGLMAQATGYAQPSGVKVESATMIDTLRLAMLQATLAEYPATGHVLNPTDWASIELTKDAQSRYVFANPVGLASPTLWGLPVAESLSMAAGNFLTGALQYAAQVFDREEAAVAISTEDSDNFQKNMVTIRAEERLALAVYRPEALIKGTFAADAPAAGG
ncbi:Major capsid protein [Acetobacter pasteurianus]|uniref:Major capsid protein n=1 Tax=Acetobacter pasteurianus TaxID=438 RepID=A0A1A0CED0_ACEPA|nr:phage major capsid protein [Acetobacter pasteurianus]OAZ61304.1 Major capsid protein [Acetobacter pasteurianus]